MMGRAWLVAAALLAAPCIGCGGGDDDTAEPSGSTAQSISSPSQLPAEARGAYFVGYRFSDFPLLGVLVPPDGAGNSTSFIYGGCVPSGDGGCAPPLEVQTWSICDRYPNAQARSRLIPWRGARAEFARRESRIEIYTGRRTVVIFSDNADLARRAAETVKPFDRPRTGSNLAPPDVLAVRGLAACQRA
jgi:hypothetical protein